MDAPTGGAGNDVFTATLTGTAMTLNAFDNLNGGEGNDTLVAAINGSVTPQSLAGIENITATFTGAATLSVDNAADLSVLTSQGSTAASTVSGMTTAVDVQIRDTAQAHTITYAGVAGSADAATVTLGNYTAAGAALTVAGIEVLTLNSVGNANTIQTLTTANTGVLNITGDQNLTITNNLGATVTTVDASAATGAVNVDFAAGTVSATGGTGNDNFSFEAAGTVVAVGGAGNDTFIFDNVGTYTVADTVTGGEGTDTLSATSATLVAASATAPLVVRTTGIEYITANTAVAAAAQINLDNISADATRLNLTAANIGAATFRFNAGSSELRSAVATAGAQTIDAAGTGSDDAITLSATAAVNFLGGQALTSTDFETVTINTSTSTTTNQTVGAISIASTGTTVQESLVFTGSNQITTGVITATGGTVDASGLTGTTGLIMVTGQNSAATITGSAGADTLFGAITTATAQTISAGAGNDSITSGAGNDTITGGAGNDTVNSGAGNDNVDLGEGNDTFNVVADANITSSDTIVGGDGTDALGFYADMTDDAAKLQAVSGFETLRINAGAAETITMSNFLNNQTFTLIEVGASGGAGARTTVNNVGSGVTTLQLGTVTAAGVAVVADDAVTFDRLVDSSSSSLTVTHDSGGAAGNLTSLIIDDEETVTISTGTDADDDLTIDALDSADMTTLNLSGAGDIIITAFTAVSDMPTTVSAAGMTGAGATTVDLTNSTAAATMTGGVGVDTFTGGIRNDVITGAGGNDVLVGAAGNDTIDGGAGNDEITGGAGVDTLTGGSGADDFNFAAGAGGLTLATADTITDFVTGSDELDVDGGGATVADGTAIVDFAALVAAVNAVFAAGAGNDDAVVYYNALGTGDAYAFVDEDDSGTLDADDYVFILTGINTATEIAVADFI